MTGLANGTKCFFTVEAVNSVGNSAPSNEASATPVAGVPVQRIYGTDAIGTSIAISQAELPSLARPRRSSSPVPTSSPTPSQAVRWQQKWEARCSSPPEHLRAQAWTHGSRPRSSESCLSGIPSTSSVARLLLAPISTVPSRAWDM